MREQILSIIEKNSRIDLHELAVILGMEETDIVNEMEQMEKEGIICGYHTLIDWEKTSVEKVNALIKRQAELLKQGVALSNDYEYQTLYEYTGLNDIKPEMIAEATRNAREAAKKFAEDSESDLGKIKSATQGQFSIEDRDAYTPYIKNVRVVTYITYYLED